MGKRAAIAHLLVIAAFFFWALPIAYLTVTDHLCYLAHRCSFDGYPFIMTPYDGVWFVWLLLYLVWIAVERLKTL